MGEIMQFGATATAVAPRQLNFDDLPKVQQDMYKSIETVDQYCKNKGTLGGLDWGMPSLNRAFEGLQPGLILVAGQANVGKSALCMQLAWYIAQSNTEITDEKKNTAYVLYFSLDDNMNELLPRVVAIDQKIPINVVKSPAKYDDNTVLMAKRTNGMEKLKRTVDRFKVMDSTSGTSIEYIEEEILRHIHQMRDIDDTVKLVVIIDNFHDITVDRVRFGDNTSAKYDYIANELSGICTRMDIPIICTAEFRKLNGMRRPMMDDIRESVKIAYEAKAILLCYNEVGLRGDSASVYWTDGDEVKRPVFEVKVGKNKYSSYKGRIFYDFIPDKSLMMEVNEEDTKRYNQMIIG